MTLDRLIPGAFRLRPAQPSRGRRGTLLVVVLWICFGLISMALLFGNSMMMENRVSDNMLSAEQASAAIDGATRYIAYLLANNPNQGYALDPTNTSTTPSNNSINTSADATATPVATPTASSINPAALNSAMSIGGGTAWILGRDPNADGTQNTPTFGLVDEASKINLNANTALIQNMLVMLPAAAISDDLAGAIPDWVDIDDDVGANGAETSTYATMSPAYVAKNGPFETISELRMLNGATMSLLLGEDINMNGFIDPNEDDGEDTPPTDSHDGILDPGLLEYVTVYSSEPATAADGSTRINVANANTATQIDTLLAGVFDSNRVQQIEASLAGTTPQSVLEFYMRSGMTPDEFSQIADKLCAQNATVLGLINVNTASQAVLATIPGIGTDMAGSLIDYRRGKAFTDLQYISWVADVLSADQAVLAGPYITTRSYQFSADIAAVGHGGRGFQRAKIVFDTSSGTPKIIFRKNLTHLGWPLGEDVHKQVDNLTGNKVDTTIGAPNSGS